MSRGLGVQQRRILEHLEALELPFFLGDLLRPAYTAGDKQSLWQAAVALRRRGLIQTWAALEQYGRLSDSEDRVTWLPRKRRLVVAPTVWDTAVQGFKPGRCKRITARFGPNCDWPRWGVCQFVVPCAPPKSADERAELERRNERETQALARAYGIPYLSTDAGSH